MDSWGASLYGDPCRECGFTWTAETDPTVSLLLDLPDSLDELLGTADGREHIPDLAWNVSAYVAHMTDNTRIWAERLIAVARGGDPHVVAYDPDLLAQARRYNDVALEGAMWSFRLAVRSWGTAVEEATLANVVMLHSERGAMELFDVVASNAHDARHHFWDLQRILLASPRTP
jgi:hypothetical protein